MTSSTAHTMDKKAIKLFATSARTKLMAAIEQRAFELGIERNSIKEPEIHQNGFRINGGFYADYQIKQRERLIDKIKANGFAEVIEEVAYTWFNRFIALRFMEVNDYLPTGVRIFSSIEPGKTEPDALTEIDLIAGDLGLDMEKVYRFQDESATEQLFKYILVKQCNQLGKKMQGIFEPISDETELLLPDHLLSESGALSDLVSMIPEKDWQDVEIIGWLYQFYNAEIKEKVGGLRNTSVSKEHLPIVTQLFTPKWIVQYMVENSLGKMYDQAVKDNRLSSNWEFYLSSENRSTHYPSFDKLEDIKLIDPACGSGHILVYAFDLLYDMYVEAGYVKRDIPELILKHNLYGLDIDKRSTQIAQITLWMKALEKAPRLLRREERLVFHVFEIPDCDLTLSEEAIDFFAEDEDEKLQIKQLQQIFENGKQFGSLLTPPHDDYAKWLERFQTEINKDHDLYESSLLLELEAKLLPTIQVALLLSQKYHIVVTNPPYHNKYNPVLKKFMQKNYKDEKSDLYAAFIVKSLQMTQEDGYAALMSPFTWMFISSHEKLRHYILENATISSLVQLEYSAFEEATVPICTFVLQNQHEEVEGQYIRLADFKGAALQPLKVKEAVKEPSVPFRYSVQSTAFSDIPGSPIAYWASEQVRKIFRENPKLGDVAEPRVGLQTGDNNRFLRLWHEVQVNRIGFGFENRKMAFKSKLKWFPHNKGGTFRKWYGNLDYVVNWENDGTEIRNFTDISGKVLSRPQNIGYYFRENITWGLITSKEGSFRWSSCGFIPGHKGSGIYFDDTSYIEFCLALLNSKVSLTILEMISPNIGFEAGSIRNMPIVKNNSIFGGISSNVTQNISLSKFDWDSFETSWDFKTHPLLEFRNGAQTLAESYANWDQEAERRFTTLKANEEELNRIFIDLYGLQDELTPEESDDEVTVRRADREREVKSFLSYAVGLMFGRYSLDEDGLIYAGGEFDRDKYRLYKPDKDNVIPITDDVYFEDDIVGRLVDVIRLIFGAETLEQNLNFIAEALEKKANETARQRIRRYFLKEFYQDHLKVYKKRPIYWLFDSGKQNGFKALVYLHRYEPGLVARVRTDYLHAVERKYEEAMNRLDLLIESDAQEREKTKAKKQKEKLQKQLLECRQYDQVIAHVANQQIEIDLDDGVKVNYAKFQGIEVPQSEGKKAPKANLLAKI